MRSHKELAELAESQYGVLSYRQLRELGFSNGAIGRMSDADRLRRIHRGVYAVGHAEISGHGRSSAGVLACGAGAVLSHSSAAWLWGLQSWCPRTPEVSVLGRGRRREGIRVHRVGSLRSEDATAFERIPVTTVAKTLVDLAGREPVKRLEGLVETSERRGLLDLGEIDAVLDRQRRGPGSARLRTATEIYRDPAFSRARSERLFLALVKRADLPRPRLNTYVEGHEVDAYWERENFAVEVDGWGPHHTRAAFERDPLRQEDLLLAGISSIRITARRIESEPQRVAERLRRHLSARSR